MPETRTTHHLGRAEEFKIVEALKAGVLADAARYKWDYKEIAAQLTKSLGFSISDRNVSGLIRDANLPFTLARKPGSGSPMTTAFERIKAAEVQIAEVVDRLNKLEARLELQHARTQPLRQIPNLAGGLGKPTNQS